MSVKSPPERHDRTGAGPPGAGGKENLDTDAQNNPKGSLAKMFKEGTDLIGSKKSDNLFEQLESRSLTVDEERIISERVDLQRRMLAAYEKQEKARKVFDICAIHPHIPEEDVEKALELCNNKEEETAARLAEPEFLRRIAASKRTGAVTSAPVVQRKPRPARARKTGNAGAGDQVFVGTFRGRGYAANPTSKETGQLTKPKPARLEEQEAEEEDTATLAPESSTEVKAVECSAESEDPGSDGLDLDGPDDSMDVGVYGDDEGVADEPQRYLLAKELSNGEMRPATTSELDGLLQNGKAGDSKKPALQTPPSVKSTKPKAGKGDEVEVSEETVNGAVRVILRQSQDKAIKFLRAMPSEVAKRALAVIKEQDGDKAAALTAALTEGGGQSLEPIAEGTESAEPDSVHNDHEEETLKISKSLSRSERLAARQSNKEQAGSDTDPSSDEASDDDSEQPVESPPKTRKRRIPEPRPSRTAKANALKMFAGQSSDADEGRGKAVIESSPCAKGSEAVKRPAGNQDGPGKQAGVEKACKASQIIQKKPLKTAKPRKGDGKTKAQEEDGQAAVEAEKPPKKQKAVGSAGKKQQQGRPPSKDAEAAPATPEDEDEGGPKAPSPEVEANVPANGKEPSLKAKSSRHAISARGHTNRGRVRQKSHKSAELVEVGSLRAKPGWYNAGYIFPEGFKSRVNFRSSVELDQLCVHECSVVGKDGQFWPAPTFVVVAMDSPQEPLVAKSCTGCWTAVLKRINTKIQERRKAGEDLPPPPKTAIAGPEYFGFNQAEVQEAVEALDPEHACIEYWQGKCDREAHAAGLPVDTSARPPKPRAVTGSKKRRKRGRDASSDEDNGGTDGDEDEAAAMSNKWSAVSRHERYRKRCGGEGDAAYVDEDNPLPGWIDPITLEPVASPTISPWGHVMGMATWKAVLSSNGKCPFTQRSLSLWQCQLLTKRNIMDFKDRIVADNDVLKKFGLR